MKWSWKVFTAFGIDVYVHATFVLLILFVVLSEMWGTEGSLARGLLIGALWLSLFGCVVLHEFGHALTAKRFGVRTRDITLLPIGGIARLERIPSEPRKELLIAVAGPLVNLVIAAVLSLFGLAFGYWGPEIGLLPGEGTVLRRTFIGTLLTLNVLIAVFNIIPAFPMDGGRILRALLATRLDYVRATRIAVGVGQALAFGFGIFGLFTGNILLVLVAFFVYMGATQEGAMVEYSYTFRGLPTSCAMMTNFNTLHEDDRLEKAVEYLLLGSQVDFPVLRDHTVAGLLTRGTLIESLGKKGPQATIRDVDLKQVKTIEDDVPLDRAYETLQEQSVRCLPVTHHGELVGLLTLENLAEFAMVSSAMRARSPGAVGFAPPPRNPLDGPR